MVKAKGPITNPLEMGMENHEKAVERIASIPGYRVAFKKVFGDKPISIDLIAKAISSYERTLITPNSPFDRFLRGEKKAISIQALRGSKVVQSIGCLGCHSGPNFAGPMLPVGQGFYQKFPTVPNTDYEKKYRLLEDLGRYVETKKDSDKNVWRVPTWRNVAATAPYFHNGSVKSLDEAVRVMAKTQLNKELNEEEVGDIVAFLETLTGEFPKQMMPLLPLTSRVSSSEELR